MIYLTEIVFSPDNSNTMHIYIKQYTEQHNETENLKRNIPNNQNT